MKDDYFVTARPCILMVFVIAVIAGAVAQKRDMLDAYCEIEKQAVYVSVDNTPYCKTGNVLLPIEWWEK